MTGPKFTVSVGPPFGPLRFVSPDPRETLDMTPNQVAALRRLDGAEGPPEPPPPPVVRCERDGTCPDAFCPTCQDDEDVYASLAFASLGNEPTIHNEDGRADAPPFVPYESATPADLIALVNDIASGKRRPGGSPFVVLPLMQADAVGDGRRLSCLSSALGLPPASKPLPVHIKLADFIVGALRAEKLTPPLRLARCSPATVESDGQLVDVIKVNFQKDAPEGVAPFCVGNEVEQEYAEQLDLAGDLEGLAAELVRGVRVGLLNEGELMRPGDVDWLGSSGALHVQRVTKGEI